MDLTALTVDVKLPEDGVPYGREGCKFIYGTGLAFEIPLGHVGLIFPRSSIYKTGMTLSNCVGVIDSDYRGEVKFVFTARNSNEPIYDIGDRVGQLVIMELPNITIIEETELNDTERGTGGFGSTGR